MIDREPIAELNAGAHRLAVAAILVFALMLRVAYALSTHNTPTFDEVQHSKLADSILAGKGWTLPYSAYSTTIPGQPTSFFEPLYPLFLAGLFSVVGTDDLPWARALQALLTTGSVALLMHLARILWGSRIALLTGLVASVYVPFIFFSGLLMTENLFIFLLLAFLVAWTRGIASMRVMPVAWAGTLYGLACLTRSALFIFLPVACMLTMHATRSDWRHALLSTTALLGAALMTIAPWTARNYLVHHAFVPITTKGGYNLFFYTYPAQRVDFNERHQVVPRPDMSGLSEVERDHRYRQEALRNIRATPGRQLEFAGIKLLDFMNPIAKRGPWPLRYGHAALFGLIVALGTYSVWFARPRAPMTFYLMLSLIVFHVALAAVFTGGGKARMPIEPLFLLTAAGGLAALMPERTRR